jgi:hypothetical protein
VAWYLNGALTRFREAVNAAYPHRDKESDGTIGDEAHSSRSSDHNPDPAGESDAGSVDAWDMDVEVNGRGQLYAADVEKLKRVFESHPSSKYWIHNDQISHRSEGWKPRSYSYAGPDRNRHEKHVHFNTREEFEESRAPWEVEDMTPDQAAQLRDAHYVVAKAIPNPVGDGRVPLHVWAAWLTGAMKALADAVADLDNAVGDQLRADLAHLTDQVEAAAREGALASVDEIVAAIPDDLAREVLDGLAARLSSAA